MKPGHASSLLLAALMVPHASGQAAKPRMEPSLDSTDAVVLNVVVHDKKNKCVIDLKPEELAVTDDGSPVTLSSLRFVSGK